MFCSNGDHDSGDSQSASSSPEHAVPSPEVPNRMTVAILATLFGFFPLGIPAIVNASRANNLAREGHFSEALLAATRAKKWIVASFCAAIIWVLVVGIGVIFSPIYVDYVSSARASDSKSTINAILQAAEVYYQDKGEWPASVGELEQEKYISINESTKLQWTFAIGGRPLETITATSTKQMKGGAGKTVIYHVKEGTWTGYGLPKSED